MTKRKKVLFCDNTLWGTLNFRGEVLEHFSQKEYEVFVVAPRDENPQMTLPVPSFVRFLPVEMGRTDMGVLSNAKYFFRILRIYAREKPNIIFHYTIKPNIYGSIAARLLHIKSVAMVAGLGTVFSRKGLKYTVARWMYRVGLRASRRVFVLNEDNCDHLRSHGICKNDKLVLLSGGEGVNLQKWPFLDNTSPVVRFLFSGRLLYDKGYKEFVEAAKILKGEHPEVEFWILGFIDEQASRSVTRAQLDKDIQEGYIRYLGYTHDMLSWYKKKGIVLTLPSYYGEGMSRTLMEACATGKPVIASDIAGCREFVEIGKNGFLVKPKDVSSLVTAMRKILALEEGQRRQFSLYSRKVAEKRFDVKNVIAKYEQVIAGEINC